MQQTESDCGVAALAMLADVSYEEALEFVQQSFRYTRALSSGKILAGLAHFGAEPLDDRCADIGERNLYDLEWNALLQCKLLADGKEYGHWAAWDAEEQVIRDPYGFAYPIRVDALVEIAW
jgi:hypothetical protein